MYSKACWIVLSGLVQRYSHTVSTCMENEAWKMEHGKLSMENGAWKMEHGKCSVCLHF